MAHTFPEFDFISTSSLRLSSSSSFFLLRDFKCFIFFGKQNQDLPGGGRHCWRGLRRAGGGDMQDSPPLLPCPSTLLQSHVMVETMAAWQWLWRPVLFSPPQALWRERDGDHLICQEADLATFSPQASGLPPAANLLFPPLLLSLVPHQTPLQVLSFLTSHFEASYYYTCCTVHFYLLSSPLLPDLFFSLTSFNFDSSFLLLTSPPRLV